MIKSRLSVAFAALIVLAAVLPAPALAKQPPAATSLAFSANPVGLVSGPDVTLTSMTTASLPASVIDSGRVVFQLATDGAGRPTSAASVAKWVALNSPGVAPRANIASLQVDLDTWDVAPATTVGFRAHYVSGSRKQKVESHFSGAADLVVSAGGNHVVRVEVEPAAALLTHVGEVRMLRATAYDADGRPVTAPISWSSTRPGTVAVDAAGGLTAGAIGSAQVRASVGDVRSAAVLVVVAIPAGGATLVSDDQIVGSFEEAAPADGCPLVTYRTRLTFSPAVGDVLIGLGAAPLEGRVVEVSTNSDGSATVVLCLLPLPEIFPHLVIDEHIDLSGAPVTFAADTAEYYDVVREGDTFDFTPITSQSPIAARRPATLATASLAPEPTEFPLGPFACEMATPLNPLPISLTNTPPVSITVNPSVDLVWTDDVQRVIVNAQPKVTATIGVALSAAADVKITCKREVFSYAIPAPGPLGLLLGATIPVGFGFEADGKITLASVGLGVSGFVKADARLGVECAFACEFVHSLDNFDRGWTLTTDGLSLGDTRLEPSFEVFGYVEFKAGNPFISFLQYPAAEAKVGLKLAASLSSRLGQVSDPEYASDYKLSLNAGAKAGIKLAAWLAALGLPEIAALELAISTDLSHSPTGRVVADRASYALGDPVHVRVRLDPASLAFLGVANVRKVVLVQSPGVGTELSSVDAVGDQSDFDFSFDATGPIAADDLYAFVATNLVPVFELELGKATPITVTIAPASASLAPNGTQQFAATVAGTTNAAVDWSASCGTISSSGLYTAPLTGPCTVTATSREWSSAKGSATATISGISVVVSPETATIVPSGQQQFTAEVTGIVNGAVVWSASCGTIDQAGLYTAPATDTVCTITATSQADPTRSGTATATIGELELVVSPEIAFVAPLGTRQFTATIGAAPADVDWGATCGSVDENGLFTAPSLEGTSSGRCLVFANLVTDPRIGGSASAYFGTPDAPTGNGDLSGYAFDNTFDSLCNGGPGGVSVSTATLAGTAPATQGGATQTSTIGIAPTLADNVLLIGGSVSSESHASADVGPGACDAPHAAYANGAASTFLTIVVRGGGVPYSLSASGALTADQTAASNGSFAFVFEADSLTAGIVSEANGPYANGQIFTTNEYPDPIADHGWLWAGTYRLFVSAGSDATAVSGESGASSAASSSLQFELVIGVSP